QFWRLGSSDTNGEVVAAAHGKSKYNSIALIELNALEQGLQLAVRHNTTRLKAQTDSTNVVSFMKQGSKPQWQASMMIKRIREQILKMETFSIKHIYREANRLAASNYT
ncbi:hypothetical protein FRX31_034627, partial [Thalictrum thalictroides]